MDNIENKKTARILCISEMVLLIISTVTNVLGIMNIMPAKISKIIVIVITIIVASLSRKIDTYKAMQNVKGLYIMTVIVGVVWLATDSKLWFF